MPIEEAIVCEATSFVTLMNRRFSAAKHGPTAAGWPLDEGPKPGHEPIRDSLHAEIFQSEQTADIAGVDLAYRPGSIVVFE